MNEVLALRFAEVVRIELGVIVEQIRSLNKGIAELEKTVGEEGSKLEGHQNLASPWAPIRSRSRSAAWTFTTR